SVAAAAGDSRGSFVRAASAGGHGGKILGGDRGYSSGQVGELAAPSRGERRNAYFDRQEVSRDGGGHRRRQRPGAQCRARWRRQGDHSRVATAIGGETPAGELSRAARRHVFGNRRPLQRERGRLAEMESLESKQGGPGDGAARLHRGRCAGEFAVADAIQAKEEAWAVRGRHHGGCSVRRESQLSL